MFNAKTARKPNHFFLALRGQRGFTLLEMLIALAIFAVTALVVLEQNSRGVHQQAQLEEKTFATWVAENALASLRLQHRWPNLGVQDDKTTFADREWRLRVDTQETPRADLRKVIVQVRDNAQSSDPIATLTGYFAKQ